MLSKHINVTINCHPDKVYEFVFDPRNLPKWASGLGSSIKKEGNIWVADSSMGRIKIKFAENNNLGVLDHDVVLLSGARTYNPMRVFQNGNGSEVVFTLYKLPNMDDKMFEEDAKIVKRDLEKLKELMEER
jgi:uncharacterized membrane protein